MRGSHLMQSSQRYMTGIIPAHAGLTAFRIERAEACRDHPRACGAHPEIHIVPRSWMGSSPRMRGSRFMLYNVIDFMGIIPAHAGLTTSSGRLKAPARDHPRACGAHSRTRNIAETTTGSSPRMRGSRLQRVDYSGGLGIIPAHAGLTSLCRP